MCPLEWGVHLGGKQETTEGWSPPAGRCHSDCETPWGQAARPGDWPLSLGTEAKSKGLPLCISVSLCNPGPAPDLPSGELHAFHQ